MYARAVTGWTLTPIVVLGLAVSLNGGEAFEVGERQRAEEAVAMAAAKARAFSDRVTFLDSSHARLNSQLQANRILLEQQSYRPRSYGFGLRATAERAGDIAGLSYLAEQVDRLDAQRESVLKEFETTLQSETWKHLTPDEQQLVAKYKLIPDFTVADLRIKPATSSIASPLGAAAGTPTGWYTVKLDELGYALAFPAKPEHVQRQDRESYVLQQGDSVFKFTRHLTPKVPADAAVDQVVEAQASATVDNQMRSGVPTASVTVHMASNPAQEIRSFNRQHNQERVDRSRITVIDREIISIEVLNVDRNNATVQADVNMFFASFQSTSAAS